METHTLTDEQKLEIILRWVESEGIDHALCELKDNLDTPTEEIKNLHFTEDCPECEGRQWVFDSVVIDDDNCIDEQWSTKTGCEKCREMGYIDFQF